MIQKPRGTSDFFADEFKQRRDIENKFVDFFSEKGYKGLETPIYEQKSLFVRSVGDQTDIVQKELFDLEKKSDEVYSLRPEFTAGVIRSLIELGIKSMPLPIKVFSLGPCFRYERPQKGRKRQFNQLNLELIGKKTPEIDASVIVDSYEFLQSIGIKEISVNLNTLGSKESRQKYAETIKGFLSTNKPSFCELCQTRMDKNPLRVMDCKNQTCKELISQAPTILDELSTAEKDYFYEIQKILEEKEVNFKIDTTLVRGLDYYTGVIFEISLMEDDQRASSLGGGGRYDELIKELDGPNFPAFGMGLGFERIIEKLRETDLN